MDLLIVHKDICTSIIRDSIAMALVKRPFHSAAADACDMGCAMAHQRYRACHVEIVSLSPC